MRRKNVVNKNVIKAISIGLSAAMAMQPVAALADELQPEENDNLLVLKEDSDLFEEETVEGNFGETKEALDDAVKSEAVASATAVITIDATVISSEAMAVLAESAAKNEVNKAEEKADFAEGRMEEGLAALEEGNAEAEVFAISANDEVTKANADISAADEAIAASNAAGNSSAAFANANEAKEHVDAAKEEAVQAQNYAVSANDACEAAYIEYYDAVEAAEKAVKEANKKLAAGSADAGAAVLLAENALIKANLVKAAREGAEWVAGLAATGAAVNLEIADAALEIANAQLKVAKATDGVASGIEATTRKVLESADKALKDAQGDEKKWAGSAKAAQDKIDDLKAAKKKLEDDLAEANAVLNTATVSANDAQVKVDGLTAAITAANAAIEGLNAQLAKAESDKAAAEAEDEAAQAALKELQQKITKEGYEKAVYGIQSDIQEASSEQVSELVEQLVKVVISEKSDARVTDIEKITTDDKMELLKLTKDDVEKYFSYKVNEDGSIDIFEHIKKVETEVVGERKNVTDLSELGTEGVDYDLEKTNPGTEGIPYQAAQHEVSKTSKKSNFSNFGEKVSHGEVSVNGHIVWNWDGKYYYSTILGPVRVYDNTKVTVTKTVSKDEVSAYTRNGYTDKGEVSPEVKAVPGVPESYDVIIYEKRTVSNLDELAGFEYDIATHHEAEPEVEAKWVATKEKTEEDIKKNDYGFKEAVKNNQVFYSKNGEKYPVVLNKDGKYRAMIDGQEERIPDNGHLYKITPYQEITITKLWQEGYYQNQGYKIEKVDHKDAVPEYWDVVIKSSTKTTYVNDNVSDISENNLVKAEQDAINRKNNAGTTLETIQKNYTDVSNNLQTTKTTLDTAETELISAQEELDKAQAVVTEMQGKVENLQNKWNDEYGKRKKTLLNLSGKSKYQEELDEAEFQLKVAENLQKLAEAKVKIKQANYDAAKVAHDVAKKAADAASKELTKATVAQALASTNQKNASKLAKATKDAYIIAKAARENADLVQAKAKKAFDDAVEAKKLVDALRLNINTSAQALANARSKYEELKAAADKAAADAEKALNLAAEAEEEYRQALARAQRLYADENRPSDDEDEEELIPEEILPAVTLTTPVAGRTVAVTATAPAEEEVEAPEVVIEEEATPTAEAPEEEKAPEVEIEDEEAPLANFDEEGKMNWWWTLIVLVFGASGAELYRRMKLKKNAEKVEK